MYPYQNDDFLNYLQEQREMTQLQHQQLQQQLELQKLRQAEQQRQVLSSFHRSPNCNYCSFIPYIFSRQSNSSTVSTGRYIFNTIVSTVIFCLIVCFVLFLFIGLMPLETMPQIVKDNESLLNLWVSTKELFEYVTPNFSAYASR